MSVRRTFLWLLALFFVLAGANHFRSPEKYLAIMPPWLPAPEWMNWISGTAEILGGIGVLVPATRRIAGWGLIALLVAIFPANLHMAFDGVQIPGYHIASWAAWARLPLQAVFVAWVWWAAVKPEKV